MRNKMLALAVIAMCAAVPYAVAGEGHDHKDHAHKADAHEAHAKEGATSVTGEIVDTGCYLAHGARGEKHASCAAKCIGDGMPMGLLTESGALYLLTPNHDNPDAYNKLKGMSAKTVMVTGMLMQRNGMSGLDVTAYKPVAMKADPKKMEAGEAKASGGGQ